MICELIEKKPRCVIAFLDEQCTLAEGSDERFFEQINQTFASHDHFTGVQTRGAPTIDQMQV